jgi:hypothetical protein
MDQENTLVVTKSRCPALNGAVLRKPGRELAETLKTWLETGNPAAAPEAASAATPQANGYMDRIGIFEESQLRNLIAETKADLHRFLKYFGITHLSELPTASLESALSMLRTKRDGVLAAMREPGAEG